MKRLIIIATCFWFIACEKDPILDNFPLKATITTSSGKTFEANFIDSETKFSKSAVPQGNEIVLSGIKREGEYSLGLVIVKPAVGTIDLSNRPGWNGTNCNFGMPLFVNSFTSWGVGSGSITIESLTDSTIKGTFNAVCIGVSDTVTITGGSFNGKLY